MAGKHICRQNMHIQIIKIDYLIICVCIHTYMEKQTNTYTQTNLRLYMTEYTCNSNIPELENEEPEATLSYMRPSLKKEKN